MFDFADAFMNGEAGDSEHQRSEYIVRSIVMEF